MATSLITQVRHPYVEWAFDPILSLTASSFLLRTRGAKDVELRGQFIGTQLEGNQVLLFMGSVRLSCLEEMEVSYLGISRVGWASLGAMIQLGESGCNDSAGQLSCTFGGSDDYKLSHLRLECSLHLCCPFRDATCTCRTSLHMTWRGTSCSWLNSSKLNLTSRSNWR